MPTRIAASAFIACAGVTHALVPPATPLVPRTACASSSTSSFLTSCSYSAAVLCSRPRAGPIIAKQLSAPKKRAMRRSLTNGVVVPTKRWRPLALLEDAPAPSIQLSNVIINEVLLLSVLAITTYAVLTVDQSAWRGWYPYEIIYRIPLDNWNSYETTLAEYPVPLKAAITGITYLLGDWLAQANALQASGRSWLDADRTRLGRATIVGLVLLGPLAHFYYEFVNDELTEWPVYAKILFDQTAYLSLYNTVYYVSLLCLEGKSVGEAIEEYKGVALKFLTSGWKLWPLVGIVTYTLIPQQNRVLWIDGIEIIYSAILSTLANDDDEAAK